VRVAIHAFIFEGAERREMRKVAVGADGRDREIGKEEIPILFGTTSESFLEKANEAWNSRRIEKNGPSRCRPWSIELNREKNLKKKRFTIAGSDSSPEVGETARPAREVLRSLRFSHRTQGPKKNHRCETKLPQGRVEFVHIAVKGGRRAFGAAQDENVLIERQRMEGGRVR